MLESGGGKPCASRQKFFHRKQSLPHLPAPKVRNAAGRGRPLCRLGCVVSPPAMSASSRPAHNARKRRVEASRRVRPLRGQGWPCASVRLQGVSSGSAGAVGASGFFSVGRTASGLRCKRRCVLPFENLRTPGKRVPVRGRIACSSALKAGSGSWRREVRATCRARPATPPASGIQRATGREATCRPNRRLPPPSAQTAKSKATRTKTPLARDAPAGTPRKRPFYPSAPAPCRRTSKAPRAPIGGFHARRAASAAPFLPVTVATCGRRRVRRRRRAPARRSQARRQNCIAPDSGR